MEQLDIQTLNPPMRVTRVVDQSGLEKLVDFFSRVKARDGFIGFDIETTPVNDFYFRKVRTIQFGDQNEQYVIDLLEFCKGDNRFGGSPSDTLYEAQGHYGKNLTANLRYVLDLITPVLCTADFTKVGVNLSFEYMCMYWNFGLRTFKFWDCTMVEKCIWAGAWSLKDYHYYALHGSHDGTVFWGSY